jgi:hypothetical protein
MARAEIAVGAETMVLADGDRLTFGRARECAVCLDPGDTGISRIAGSIAFANGTWWVTNESTTRPLCLVDDLGLRSVLPPGRRAALEATTRVLVDGTERQHSLRVDVDPGRPRTLDRPVPAGAPTAIGAEVMISPADRLALVALFAGYLEESPHYDPYPKSYAAAAARLGWKRSTLVKRIEYLRLRLDAAGVPNMRGFSALNNLAEYVISRGLVTRADRAMLHR